MHLRRIQKSKFFVGISVKQRKFIIHPKFMVANHIIADQFIQNLKSNPNKVHELPSEMKISLKNGDRKKLSNCKYRKSHASLTIMIKHNTVEGHMKKM